MKIGGVPAGLVGPLKVWSLYPQDYGTPWETGMGGQSGGMEPHRGLHHPEARTRALGKGRGTAMETESRWTGLGEGGDMRARSAVCPGAPSGSGQGISGTILELRTQEALQRILGLPFWSQ